jgi:hypothetical protein
MLGWINCSRECVNANLRFVKPQVKELEATVAALLERGVGPALPVSEFIREVSGQHDPLNHPIPKAPSTASATSLIFFLFVTLSWRAH